MTQKEFALFAAALKTYYPREQMIQSEQAMQLWYELLQDIDLPVAKTVLAKWAATEKWPPTIADIRENCAEITKGRRPDWGDAWDNVMRLIRRYGYMREDKILAELDDTTREVVIIMGLQEICASETADLAYRRMEFKELYNSRLGHKNTVDQLPASLVEDMGRLREQNVKLIGGAE